MKYLLFFLFLLPVVFASMPGEKIAQYPNISHVTYPCYNEGDDVYIYGNVSAGQYTCYIVHYYQQSTETATYTGGGGGSIRRIYKMIQEEKPCVSEPVKPEIIPDKVEIKLPENESNKDEPIPEPPLDSTVFLGETITTYDESPVPTEKLTIRRWSIILLAISWIILLICTIYFLMR